jgi:Ca-activated chloride channel homolog
MKRTVAFVVFVALTLACRSTHAPEARGSRSGSAPPRTIAGYVVLDGAPLPGATVTLQLANGQSFTQVTTTEGRFDFRAVPPGKYRLRAELSGLRTMTWTVRASDQTTPLLLLPMRVDTASEAITVTAAAPTVLDGTISAKNELPSSAEYTTFDDAGYIETARHATSTFSIDVDTASYAMVRRMLNDGTLPPRDAVRVEELLNYFTYDYPEPQDGQPFSVTTEVAGAPWNPSHRLLRIGIRGKQLARWDTKPRNLVFLLDTSGSMMPANRLPLLKQAFRMLVEQLRAEDRVAIVAYAGSAGLVLPSTSGADKAPILAALDALQSGGSTAGGAGIELAYKVAKESFIEGGTNRVILATDGDFNVGVSSEDDLLKLIEEKRKDDIELTTIGVGEDNYKDAKLELLADKGNGNYAYVDTLAEARKVFVEQIGGTLDTIAKDVKLQLEFDPRQVASFRQIGYEDRQLADADFHDDTKDAGELGSGHIVTALYELVPAAGARSGDVAKLQLRFKPPHGIKSQLLQFAIRDDGRSAWEASDDLKFASAITEMAMLLRDSKFKGSASWDEALQLAKVSRGADLNGRRGELLSLMEKAKTLSETHVAVAQAAGSQ